MSKKMLPLAILVEESYQVLEVWYPYLRLKEEGIPVVIVGTGSKDIYPSKEGYPIKVDVSIDQIKPKDFSGVIIPGGWAPDFLRRYEKVVRFVRQLFENKKVVAAICHGGWLLVSAKILLNKKATCFFAIKEDVIAAGAKYCDAETVVDGNLVTARKPEDLPLFTKTIIQLIKKQKG